MNADYATDLSAAIVFVWFLTVLWTLYAQPIWRDRPPVVKDRHGRWHAQRGVGRRTR